MDKIEGIQEVKQTVQHVQDCVLFTLIRVYVCKRCRNPKIEEEFTMQVEGSNKFNRYAFGMTVNEDETVVHGHCY